MPAPYSYDLRKKAIDAVKRGERKINVCRLLKISRNTLDLWLKREKETGDIRAIEKYQKGNQGTKNIGVSDRSCLVPINLLKLRPPYFLRLFR